MAGVAKCAKEIDEGTIVTVSPDGGWKYLSTDVWTGDLDDGRRAGTPRAVLLS